MTELKAKKVLVTGATGFLGGHIAEAALSRGAKVFFTYRDKNKDCYFFNSGLDKKAVGIKCDLNDLNKIKQTLKKYKIEYIFHFAGLLPSVHKQPEVFNFFSDNVVGTLNLLEAVKGCPGVEAVIVPSSIRVLDAGASANPYDASKIATELLVNSYYKTHNLPVTIGRVSNVFGPGDVSINRIMPSIMQALVKKQVLKLKSSGKAKKNFIFTSDLAEGFMKLAENIAKAKGQTVNFLGKDNFSISELIIKTSKALKREVKFEVGSLTSDSAKLPKIETKSAQKLLSWRPKVGFDEAVFQTYTWYKDYFSK